MPLVDKEPMTHYEGCWEVHHECAVARVKKLEAELKQMQELFDMLDISIFDDRIVKVVAKK